MERVQWKNLLDGNQCKIFENVKSIKVHHVQLIAKLESYKKKPAVIAISDTWLSKNANLKGLE